VRTVLLSVGTMLLLLAAQTGLAAEQDPLARLDEALKSVATFEYGKDSAPLATVEQVVVTVAADPTLRAQVEERLARVLAEPATRDAKEFLCRQLFTIGTARSVPQLEALLTDPGLSHMARFALVRNEGPAAAAALQRALSRTSGNLQVGVLNSLGDRRYEPAVLDISKLLASPDPAVAQAAALALGKISGTTAVQALESARPKASKALGDRIDEALLIAADRFQTAGQPAVAVKIYRSFFVASQPIHLRIAGLRGVVATADSHATAMLIESIKGSDQGLRAAAIGFSRTGPKGQLVTRDLAALLPSLAPSDQELLLSALADRADGEGAPAALQALKSEDQAVRLAAYHALGHLGGAATVDLLLRAAAGDNPKESAAARASLVTLNRGDVTTALLHALDGRESKSRIEALRAIAARHMAAAAPKIFTLTTDPDSTVRQEAIRALGEVIDETGFERMVGLAQVLSSHEDLAALEQAANAAFQRAAKPESETTCLVAALPRSKPQAKPVLLRLLGRAATPGELQAVRSALADEVVRVRAAAVRVLADWPDAAPAADLLNQMHGDADQVTKVIALRGYVRMAGVSKDPAAMYARALDLAQRPEDKKLVLSGLGTAGSVQALQLVEPFLKDEQLRTEAALAAVQIADRLRQTDAARAKAVLKEALAATADPGVRKQGQEALNQIEQYEDYILDWVGAGPYQAKGKDGHALFEMPFPPEQPAAAVNWTKFAKGMGPWNVDLGEALGGGDNVVGYARTRVWSPAAQPGQLELGSDDGVKVWLNGSVVHANNTERGLGPRQDLVKVDLKEGWNELLLKITNQGGGWAFCCRVRHPDGNAIDGLKVESK
jgi:HEAT repeat protein